jgi:ATP-dependent RNA helicase RhlE
MKFVDFGIDEQIIRSISKKGFKKPTDIQYKSIPHILRGEDVLAIAQTGTGKTAAFAIPVLHLLKKKKIAKRADGIKCIVMVPTHELAQQITNEFVEFGKHTPLKILGLYGGVEQDPQILKLEKGVDILVATPGRMFDLISQGYIKLNRVEILILDEADHMLDLGFIKDIKQLITHLPTRRQTLFFSATINQKIKKLAYSLVHKPIRIQISPKNPVAKNIDHSKAFIEMDDKRFFLERLIKENEESKMLVFVRTKVRAERVVKAMERVNIETKAIHSGKDQVERDKVMKAFRSGELKVLVATDVSARGIDIPNVDMVVNYDLPELDENYVHRVGRTGRGREKGWAISFCSSEEKETLETIESFLGAPIKEMEISSTEYSLTVDFSEEKADNWEKLMLDHEIDNKAWEIGKKKKKKK